MLNVQISSAHSNSLGFIGECAGMTISALGECGEWLNAHWEKMHNESCVFGEFGECTVVGLKRTRLRIRLK